MGTLTTDRIGGTLIGPIIGGYGRYIWLPDSVLYVWWHDVIASITTLVFVKENFHPADDPKYAERSAFTGIKHVRVVWAMIISSMLIQAATTSINPIISLFVKE